MTEGLITSGIGLATVFGVLIIIILMMMIMARFLRDKEVSTEVGRKTEAVSGEIVRSTQADTEESTGPQEMSLPPGVNLHEEPEGTDEVAAIVLALAAYIKNQGKELRAQQIVIGNLRYAVDIGDITNLPAVVIVNGEGWWTSFDGIGLPVAGQDIPRHIVRMGDIHHSQAWRSAYPLGQGGYWDRRGWGKAP